MKKGTNNPYYMTGLSMPEPSDGGGPNLQPWDKTRVVGQAMPRVDAYEKVSGSAVFPSDVSLPGMLHGGILRCPHPHARVKSIDTSLAEKAPGVRMVLTASSPGCDLRWSFNWGAASAMLFDPHCLFEGDEVAAVAADSPYQVADALRAIKVEYEVLPFLSDERKALDPAAPKLRDSGNQVGEVSKYDRGDVEKGFAEADLVLEETYRIACQLHTPLEAHGCVANWDGDSLTVWESTQGVFGAQQTIAAALGMPLSKVRVIGHYMGGGFGSKLEPGKNTIIAALLAKATGRPVRLFLKREETFLVAGNRPPATMKLKAGVRKDGTLTAFEFTVTGSGGAYPSSGTSLIDFVVQDLYSCPNVRSRMTDVLINAGCARPMRAPGHPQGAWALEQMMDALADKLHMDPVELRLKNVPTVAQPWGNIPFTSTGFRQCLEDGAKAFGWTEARRQAEQSRRGDVRRGVGMAGGMWIGGAGGPPSTVIVKMLADGSVNLNMGAADLGTGTKTVMAMIVAEELGVDPRAVQIEHADTGTTQFTEPSGGSKTVATDGPPTREAAVAVKKQLLEMAATELKTTSDDIVLNGPSVSSRSDPTKSKRIGELPGFQEQGVIVGVGRRGPNPRGKAINPFAAQFCEVEVNVKTGEIKVLRFLGAQDSGRVMNLLTYRNQVFGGFTMGMGLALTEERVLDGEQSGKMLNVSWHDYKLPTMMDVPPDMVCLPIDLHDLEANSIGAKGLGEPATVPSAAVVANAVFNATGVRLADSPISPVRLRSLLSQKKEA